MSNDRHDLTPAQMPATLASTVLGQQPGTSAELIDALKKITVRSRRFQAGEVLLTENEASSSLLFLSAGWACRYVNTRGGKRHASAILLSGDACNLESLFENRASGAIQMLTPGTILSIPASTARDLVATDARIAEAFLRVSLAQQAILRQRTLWLGRLSARDRVLHLLCEMSYRIARPLQTRMPKDLDVPLTQEWMADLLGMTTVHVNRTLQQLRMEGVVASRTHRIVIPDISALRALTAFDPHYLQLADDPSGQ